MDVKSRDGTFEVRKQFNSRIMSCVILMIATRTVSTSTRSKNLIISHCQTSGGTIGSSGSIRLLNILTGECIARIEPDICDPDTKPYRDIMLFYLKQFHGKSWLASLMFGRINSGVCFVVRHDIAFLFVLSGMTKIKFA